MALVGAQMFTLRDHCKDIEGIAASCKRVKEMGYDGIQASGGGFGSAEPAEVKKILDDLGLKCAATHEPLDKMLNDTKAIIDKHHTLDCKYTAIGGFWPPEGGFNEENWNAFVPDFNKAVGLLGEAGIRLGYHNHSHEFAEVKPGQIAIQKLVDELVPEAWFEFDMYWVAHGGGDPAAWVEKVAGRIPCVHYKDLMMNPDRTHYMTEVGAGNLNWPRINEACAAAGVEWYLVERDAGLLDPFESLEISLKNIRSWGI